MADWKRASEMLDRFERDEKLYPADAEKLVAEVFRACGHPVADSGFVESDRGVDMFLETKVDGAPHRISVEVKYSRGPAGEASVRQLLAFREQTPIDRAMIVSRSGFTSGALRLAADSGVGLIDLLSPGDLRNWLQKHAPQAQPDKSAEIIIRGAMKALAKLIAEIPSNSQSWSGGTLNAFSERCSKAWASIPSSPARARMEGSISNSACLRTGRRRFTWSR
nr:restriction endonuclease [Phenylobacterium sp.]